MDIIVQRPFKEWVKTNFKNWVRFKFIYTPRTLYYLHGCELATMDYSRSGECDFNFTFEGVVSDVND